MPAFDLTIVGSAMEEFGEGTADLFKQIADETNTEREAAIEAHNHAHRTHGAGGQRQYPPRP